MLSDLFLIFVLCAAGILFGLSIRDTFFQAHAAASDEAEDEDEFSDSDGIQQWVWCVLIVIPLMVLVFMWRQFF